MADFMDELNLNSKKSGGTGKGGGNHTNKKLAIIILVGGFFVLMIFAVIAALVNSGKSGAKKEVVNESIETDTETLECKSLAKLFLTKFYNYNNVSYLEQRKEAEKMMTSGFLDSYKKIFYDTDFEKLVLDSYLVVEMSYDRLLSKAISNGMQIKVTGYIKYINAKKQPYTSITQPGVWIVEIVKEEGEYKINDLLVL